MASSNHLQARNSHSQPAFSEHIRLRPATLFDTFEIARIYASAHEGSALTAFLFPHRLQHPNCYIRGVQQRAVARLLNPRNLTFMAIIPSKLNRKSHEKEEAVGYAVFSRVGDDDGAKSQIASRKSVWLWILSWVLWVVVKVWNVVLGGNKSSSPSAYKALFGGLVSHADFWDPVKFPERQNRWHAQSVAVVPEHQGKGIGKLLMKEVITRAEEEGVCIGLESSPSGELMYKSVGFELQGRFSLVLVEEERDRGGVMLWRPKGWVDGKGLVKKSTMEEQ